MAKKKASKSKTSSVKQRNRLRNKGKVKTKKHVSKAALLAHIQNKPSVAQEPAVADDDAVDSVVDMVEDDDLAYLRNAISQQKYGLYKQIRIKKKNPDIDEDDMEKEYESSHSIHDREYNTRMLLPIKTKDGVERRFTDCVDRPEKIIAKNADEKREIKFKTKNEDDEVSWLGTVGDAIEIDPNEPVSMAKIYAKREELIQKYKYRIGLMCSTLLENPEQKIGHLTSLLEILDKSEPELQLTVKKLAILSLLEVFKDLIPAYQIKHQDVPFKKLKKVTQQLIGFESQLLKGYEKFLLKLEKMAKCLRKKKGDNRILGEPVKRLGKLAVACLCELLIAHPYFNFADNIVHLLTLYLDNPDESVRKTVEKCYAQIFREDKRGLISLIIVRRINHLVKMRAHSVHTEALSVLLSLRIKNVNLDQEKEDEMRNKKLSNRRQKLLMMSKKERKKKKELDKLEKEMLEVKAEENKKTKEQHMTEIMKMVFLIYFRILKRAPRSNLLSITLEGLAKFAHCINLEYFQDIVNVLDHLLETEPLNVREQLYCVKTVFIILSGQGDVLNIDPLHFYSHLYRIMLNIHAGKTHDCAEILLSTLEVVLIHKRKKVTTQRLLSFTKRLATLALQLLHNSSLASMAILKSIIQLSSATDLLLDVDSQYGQGVYNAELNEPEYCNAGNTALWELTALSRHYHPVVQKLSTHLSNGAPTTGEGSLSGDLVKLSCMNFYEQYDPSSVTFKPSIPPPRRIPKEKRIKLTHSSDSDFVQHCHCVLNDVPNDVEFLPLLNN